jgi:hypothetical protein
MKVYYLVLYLLSSLDYTEENKTTRFPTINQSFKGGIITFD